MSMKEQLQTSRSPETFPCSASVAGALLAEHIINLSQAADKTPDIKNPGYWPNWAEYGIDYQYYRTTFPDLPLKKGNLFFSSEAELNEWKAKAKVMSQAMGHDFVTKALVYLWDWGPQFQEEILY